MEQAGHGALNFLFLPPAPDLMCEHCVKLFKGPNYSWILNFSCGNIAFSPLCCQHRTGP